MEHPDHLQHLPEDPQDRFLLIPAAVCKGSAKFREQFRIRILKAAAHQIIQRIPEDRHDIHVGQQRPAALSLFEISLPKMYEFARSGKVHSLEIGRRVLVSRSSIMALLTEREESNGN